MGQHQVVSLNEAHTQEKEKYLVFEFELPSSGRRFPSVKNPPFLPLVLEEAAAAASQDPLFVPTSTLRLQSAISRSVGQAVSSSSSSS